VNDIDPPEAATASPDGDEVLRLWIADGGSHVSLLYGVFGEDEPKVWGMLLADAAAHVVNAARAAQPDVSVEALFAQVEQGFRERLAHNPTVAGTFAGGRLQ
jgi:hypothetical protein